MRYSGIFIKILDEKNWEIWIKAFWSIYMNLGKVPQNMQHLNSWKLKTLPWEILFDVTFKLIKNLDAVFLFQFRKFEVFDFIE